MDILISPQCSHVLLVDDYLIEPNTPIKISYFNPFSTFCGVIMGTFPHLVLASLTIFIHHYILNFMLNQVSRRAFLNDHDVFHGHFNKENIVFMDVEDV